MSKFLKYFGFLTALYCAVMFYITADSEKNPELFYGILFLILIQLMKFDINKFFLTIYETRG